MCLEIKKKMCALEKLYNLVKTLKMNNDKMEHCCGVSTDFIRKLTDLFFIIIGEKASTNIPLSKMYRLRKFENWQVYMYPCTNSLSTILHILTKDQTFLRNTSTETWDVFVDIPIVLDILNQLLGYLLIPGKCYSLIFHMLK